MIRNKKKLLQGIPEPSATRRRVLLDIADFVLHELQPEKLLKGAFPKTSLQRFEKIVVIGIGKAARGMVKTALNTLPRKPDAVLLADSGHPLPTPQGIQKTARIMHTARLLGEKDLAVILLSGGGSAMLAAPAGEVTLSDTITVTKTLLKGGATIQEMNVVRKHLDAVKGGRLAALLYPATVWGLVISDVPGNDLSTIASGPLSPDSSTFSDALRILKKYRIKTPGRIMRHLEHAKNHQKLETPKPGEKYFQNVRLRVIADHRTAIKKALQKAGKMGLSARALPGLLTGEARLAGKKIIRAARPGQLLVAGGETTVRCCPHPGHGGRNQELVLSGLEYLKKNQTLLAIGTDGVDGICPQAVAGAIADENTRLRAEQRKLRIAAALKQNDSYTFFKKTGGLILTGPTSTNLGDLVMLLTA